VTEPNVGLSAVGVLITNSVGALVAPLNTAKTLIRYCPWFTGDINIDGVPFTTLIEMLGSENAEGHPKIVGL